MRVDPKTFVAPQSAAPAPRRPAAQAFRPSDSGAAAKSGAAASAAPLATLDALLALQGEESPGERRRRSLKRGHDLLDALDRLKVGLLAGRISAGDLASLAARLAERPEFSGDPRLDDLIAHIELRAQVEVAKLSGRQA